MQKYTFKLINDQITSSISFITKITNQIRCFSLLKLLHNKANYE